MPALENAEQSGTPCSHLGWQVGAILPVWGFHTNVNLSACSFLCGLITDIL